MSDQLVNLSSLEPAKKRQVWALIQQHDPAFMENLKAGDLAAIREIFDNPPVLVQRSYLQRLELMSFEFSGKTMEKPN